jgi:hypothetical protein
MAKRGGDDRSDGSAPNGLGRSTRPDRRSCTIPRPDQSLRFLSGEPSRKGIDHERSAALAAIVREDHRLLGVAGDLRRREAPDRRPPGGRPSVGRGDRRRGRRGVPAAVSSPPRPGRRGRVRPAGRRTIPPQPRGRAPPRGWGGFHVGDGGHAGRGAASLLGRPARDLAHRRAGLRAAVRPADLRLSGRTPPCRPGSSTPR